MKKNIIVKGDIGVGKTKNVLFPAFDDAIKNGESIVTFSTTEEYLSNFYDKLKKENYNVIIINFNDIKRSMGWNPLSRSYKIYKEKMIDEAVLGLEKLYKNLFKTVNRPKNTDEFWVNSAISLAVAVTLSLFIKGDDEKVNISNVASIIRDGNLKEYLKEFNDDTLMVYSQSFIMAPPETSGGIVSVCLQTLRLYESRPNLRRMLENTTYNKDKFGNDKSAIFIVNDEDNLVNVPLVISYIAEICLFAKKSKNVFKIILDEMEVLLPFLDDDFVYQVRNSIKHNYSFMLSVQNDDMLVERLGHYILTLTEMIDAKEREENKNAINRESVTITEELLG